MPIAVVLRRDAEADGRVPQLTDQSCVSAAIWSSEHLHSDLSDVSIVHKEVRIGDLPSLAGTESTDVRCALRLDSPARWRRKAIAVLRSVDGLGHVVGVDEPIAAFANNWYLDPTHNPDRPLRIVAVAHGETCTMVVGHTGQRRVVAVGLIGGSDHITELTERGVRFSQKPLSIEVPLRWASTLSAVGAVVTFGLDHHRRSQFDELFGSRATHQESGGVLNGLTRMCCLTDWSASWPTTRVQLGSGWTRQPGPLRTRLEEHTVRLRPGAEIQFSDTEGRLVPVRAGSVSARGCVIPDRLGTEPRVQLFDDGRLVMSGPTDADPLAMKVAWPIPASGKDFIEVRAVGRAGVELVDPFVKDLVGVNRPS